MITGYFAGEEEAGRWLVHDDSKPTALIYYAPERMTEGTYNALLLAVSPERQGQGVGADLMAAAEQALKRQGGRILLVETSSLPEFEGARHFYEKIGYKQEAKIREFYAAGEDKIVFRKAL